MCSDLVFYVDYNNISIRGRKNAKIIESCNLRGDVFGKAPTDKCVDAVVDCVFTLFVLVTATLYYFANHYRIALANEREVLGVVVKHLELNLNVRLMALQFLASDVGMKKLDSETLRKELIRSVKILNFFNARVFDKEGKLVEGALASPFVTEAHDAYSFKQVLLGKQVISDAIVSEKNQKPYVSLRVPVYNDSDQVDGVLAGGILLEELGKLIEAEHLPSDHYIFIKDNNNQMIYYPGLINSHGQDGFFRDLSLQVGQKFSGEIVDKTVTDEVDNLYIYSTLENSDWQIVMVVPLNQVYITVLRRSAYHLALLCLVLLCAGLLYRNLRQNRYLVENIQRLRVERLMSVNQLAAGLAHEIRNPLTPIKGFVQLMTRKANQIPNQYHLEIILTEIDRIEGLLNEFQQLTIPLKNPDFVKVDMEEMTNNIIVLMQGQAVNENITLTASHKDGVFIPNYVNIMDGALIHKNYQVLGDKAQLKQVLINLFKNAIDAVGQNGMIDITLSSQDKMVAIIIRDNGVGMSSDVLGKIGTPFFTTKESGNGIGLSICYNIIEGHGGRIEVDSEVGKGSIFSVILPCIE